MRLAASWKRIARRWLLYSALRHVARPVYALIVGLELAAQRVLDTITPPAPVEPDLLAQLTAVIKTFERPQALRRLVRSIRRLYPGLRVIVVDDSLEPLELPGIETVILPYDSGVGAGRQAGLRRVETPYILNLDDDFVFCRLTGLGGALALMQRVPEIDIMGGAVVNLPLFECGDYSTVGLFATRSAPVRPPGTHIGGLVVHDKVPNFFLGRTERVRLVDWDPALKRVDHADFFTRARGTLLSVYNPDLRCLHVPTPFDRAYMAKRTDIDMDALVLRLRYAHAHPDTDGSDDCV